MKLDSEFPIKPALPRMPAGILGGFIANRIDAYQNGVFSRTKEHAVLLALTDIPLRDQAKSIAVSEGVLRTWRSEQPFQARLQHYLTAFLEVLPRFGAIALQKFCAAIDDSPPLDETVPAHRTGFGDAHLYSEGLFLAILKRSTFDLYDPLDYSLLAPLLTRKLSPHTGTDPKQIRTLSMAKVREALRWVIPLATIVRAVPDKYRAEHQASLAHNLFTLTRVLLDACDGGPTDMEALRWIRTISWLGSLEATATPFSQEIHRKERKKVTRAMRTLLESN